MLAHLLSHTFFRRKNLVLRKDYFRMQARANKDVLVGVMLVLLAAMLRTAYEGVSKMGNEEFILY